MGRAAQPEAEPEEQRVGEKPSQLAPLGGRGHDGCKISGLDGPSLLPVVGASIEMGSWNGNQAEFVRGPVSSVALSGSAPINERYFVTSVHVFVFRRVEARWPPLWHLGPFGRQSLMGSARSAGGLL